MFLRWTSNPASCTSMRSSSLTVAGQFRKGPKIVEKGKSCQNGKKVPNIPDTTKQSSFQLPTLQ